MNIVPAEEMTVETTIPHRRWKLPLADTLAISAALLIEPFPIVEASVYELTFVNKGVVYRFWYLQFEVYLGNIRKRGY